VKVRPSEPPIGLQREVEALRQDLAEARDQQAATSEVLSVLGRSKSDLQPVFETVVHHATRLCRAEAGHIWTFDGRVYRLAFASGGSGTYRELLARSPISADPGTLVGRVARERRTIHIPDVLADTDYRWRESIQASGQRTMLGVPILRDGQVIGVISMIRTKVDPFTRRQIELITTFAAQGAIAIRNGQLFKELETQSAELAHSVEELRALNDVSQAVSSTLDLQQVLKTIVTHAVKLSGTDGGSVFEFDEDAREFRLSTAYGTTHELQRALRETRIGLENTLVGRAASRRQPQAVPDLAADESGDPHLAQLVAHGWRSMLAIPLHREDRILGALVVRRRTAGHFSSVTADLLETFASQSALAIQNAQLFREINEKSRQVEVASRHKSEFLASMSHELRTPLNAVIGFSEVLLEGMFGELNEKQCEYLKDIRDSGRHLLELLNEILDLSKIEAGRMELEPGSFSLATALEGGLTMVRDRAVQHGISLSLEVDPGVDLIVADELRIKQVILNVLTNAVKFTPDGGRVDVEARPLGDQVEVTVRDTGIGIPEQDHARIFESFQQGGRGAKSEEGTGLGLTLSRRIVELHGGSIWVRSAVGEGSTFGFTIPVRSAAPGTVAPAAPALEPAQPGGARPTVLVIEDDEHSVDLLSLYLAGAGFNVECARDGRQGLEAVRSLRPAVILLDIVLPELDGWDLLATVKADPKVADIPVVIVSMLDERGKGFALGAADYLLKPVARDDLLGAVDRVVPEGGLGLKVLAIDDDPRALELIEAVLGDAGYEVLSAGDGDSGIALARIERPSVILLDLLMPEVDGFEVVERLRADPSTSGIPIVVLTAKSMSGAEKERLEGQISYLARKGDCDRAALVELVGRFSGAPGAAAAEGGTAWPTS
jgi:signal transduction histidine kinase/DNA-binding response OmpR family regulator